MVTFAVTTRSRLKSVRFFFPMLRASLKIRRQLAQAPGCLRFANIVMGPKDFWTLTVWRTRQEMLDFMRSGAHEDIMWDFSKWLDSFWLMRWRPSQEERGAWGDLTLAQRAALPRPAPVHTRDEAAALEAALDSMPRLRAASGPSGAASIDYAPQQRRARGQVAGAVGGTLRIEVSKTRDVVLAWRRLRVVSRALLADDDVFRCAFGTATRSKELYLLALFRNPDAWARFGSSPEVMEVFERWPAGAWTMRWDADNEFGHWDGFRLRRAKLGTMVEVPDAARDLSTTAEERAAAQVPGPG